MRILARRWGGDRGMTKVMGFDGDERFSTTQVTASSTTKRYLRRIRLSATGLRQLDGREKNAGRQAF